MLLQVCLLKKVSQYLHMIICNVYLTHYRLTIVFGTWNILILWLQRSFHFLQCLLIVVTQTNTILLFITIPFFNELVSLAKLKGLCGICIKSTSCSEFFNVRFYWSVINQKVVNTIYNIVLFSLLISSDSYIKISSSVARSLH